MTDSLSWADLVKEAGEAGAFDPVPDGDYDMTVTEATYKPSKQGKKMWATKNRIEGGPHNGRVVWDNLVVTPESSTALMFFFRKMGALGLSQDYFKTAPTDQQIADALKGRRFRATLETRTYNGNKSNSIKTYHSLTDSTGPLPPSVAPGQTAPPPPAPQAQTAPPPPAPAPAAPAPPAPAPQAAAPAPPAPTPEPTPVQQAAPPAPAPEPAAAPPAPAPAPAPQPEPQAYAPPTPPSAEPQPVAAGSVPPPPPPF